MEQLINQWTDFIEGARRASEVELTSDCAIARGQEPDGATWEYYQYADENFIRISEYNKAE